MAVRYEKKTTYEVAVDVSAKATTKYEAELRLAYKCVMEACTIMKATRRELDSAMYSVGDTSGGRITLANMLEDCVEALHHV